MISLINANGLHIPLADNSVHCCVTSLDISGIINVPRRTEYRGVLFLSTCRFSTNRIFAGKTPSTCGLYVPGCSSRQRQTRGGRFVMRNEKGQFVDGDHGIKTRFKKGEHWRPEKPYWNHDWLYAEYVIKGRSSSDIAADWGITENAIHFWLRKLGIQTRSISEARGLKHWGLSGSKNGMYGKKGESSSNWKGGVTAQRQGFYSSIEWRKAAQKVWRRDKGVCRRCGEVAKQSQCHFHIHHIVSFAVKELRAEPSNLVILCDKCHRWVHSSKNINSDFIRKEVQ